MGWFGEQKLQWTDYKSVQVNGIIEWINYNSVKGFSSLNMVQDIGPNFPSLETKFPPNYRKFPISPLLTVTVKLESSSFSSLLTAE